MVNALVNDDPHIIYIFIYIFKISFIWIVRCELIASNFLIIIIFRIQYLINQKSYNISYENYNFICIHTYMGLFYGSRLMIKNKQKGIPWDNFFKLNLLWTYFPVNQFPVIHIMTKYRYYLKRVYHQFYFFICVFSLNRIHKNYHYCIFFFFLLLGLYILMYAQYYLYSFIIFVDKNFIYIKTLEIFKIGTCP